MALGAIEKYGINVKLMPCTCHYYKQHMFRSKVFVEFGQPHEVPKDIAELYKTDKRGASSKLLEIIEYVCM